MTGPGPGGVGDVPSAARTQAASVAFVGSKVSCTGSAREVVLADASGDQSFVLLFRDKDQFGRPVDAERPEKDFLGEILVVSACGESVDVKRAGRIFGAPCAL